MTHLVVVVVLLYKTTAVSVRLKRLSAAPRIHATARFLGPTRHHVRWTMDHWIVRGVIRLIVHTSAAVKIVLRGLTMHHAIVLRQATASRAPTTASTLAALTQRHVALTTAGVAVQVEVALVLVTQALLPVAEVLLLLVADKTKSTTGLNLSGIWPDLK